MQFPDKIHIAGLHEYLPHISQHMQSSVLPHFLIEIYSENPSLHSYSKFRVIFIATAIRVHFNMNLCKLTFNANNRNVFGQ